MSNVPERGRVKYHRARRFLGGGSTAGDLFATETRNCLTAVPTPRSRGGYSDPAVSSGSALLGCELTWVSATD
jgi:hypothetical protein